MNLRVSNQKTAAMTLVEVFVVIVVLAVLATVFLSTDDERVWKGKARTINCVNNLKQIGITCRVWEGDHGDKYPMQTSVTNGGTMELNADGKNTWLNFIVMSNELVTPKVLVCPADSDRTAATNFSSQLVGHISYFINLNASDAYPQMFLSGDDNFAIGGVSVESGLLEISTNAPIAWTADRHDVPDKRNFWAPTRHSLWGNIGFTDGSVASVNNFALTNLLHQTGVATNRLAIP